MTETEQTIKMFKIWNGEVLKIPLSIYKEIPKLVVFGRISLPSYVLKGDGILSSLHNPPPTSSYPASWG